MSGKRNMSAKRCPAPFTTAVAKMASTKSGAIELTTVIVIVPTTTSKCRPGRSQQLPGVAARPAVEHVGNQEHDHADEQPDRYEGKNQRDDPASERALAGRVVESEERCYKHRR